MLLSQQAMNDGTFACLDSPHRRCIACCWDVSRLLREREAVPEGGDKANSGALLSGMVMSGHEQKCTAQRSRFAC
jgi:hypothetical protein